ncbi:MAG TPA: DUF4226 domain-containing protein [Mycobacterium sp.]|nr:DUF4226 domain-containing protein [Mycobacterium sp.]
MAEQSGPSVAAIRAKQAALADRYRAAADADQALVEVVQGGYAGGAAAGRRLDTIAAELDACVEQQSLFAVDTPMGAREFQRLLLAKQRQLIAVVVEAQQDVVARRELLRSLQPRYRGSANTS